MSNGHNKKRKKHKSPKRVVNVTEKKTGEEPTEQTVHQELKPKESNMAGERWTAKLGVGLAAIVAVIYFLQWRSMIDSVNITRKASEREDRAWVTVQPKGPFQIVPGGQLGIPFTLINTGKTPARRIHAEMWAGFVPVNSQGDMTEKGPRLEMETGDLFPNNVNVVEIFKGAEIIRQRRTSPGGHDTEAWPIEAAEVQDFDQNRVYAAGYMVVSYYDIFGVRHWTRFCAFIQPPNRQADTSKCVAYNGEDDNEEP